MRKLLGFFLLSFLWLTSAFAQSGNVGIYGTIQGSGSFIAISVDGSGNFSAKNSIIPNGATAVPITTQVQGSGTGLVISSDASSNFTYAVAPPPNNAVPVIGYAAGTPSSININATTGVVTAGSYSTTLANLFSFALQQATLTQLKAALAAAAISNPVDAADYPSPPSFAESASHNAALSVQANVGPQGSQFWNSLGRRYIRGGTAGLFIGTSNETIGTGNLVTFSGLVPTLVSGDSNYTYQVGFVTSSQLVELNLRVVTAASPFRLIVNGQFVNRTAGYANVQQFVTLDFGSSASRTIIVETQGGGAPLINVAVSAGQTITAATVTDIRSIVFGDSITEGASNGAAVKYVWDTWFASSAKQLGFTNVQNAAIGGTGYWNQSGGATNNRLRIVDAMPQAISATTYSVVTFAGGYNDQNQVSNATTAALALQAWRAARLAQPGALIIVMGIPGEATGPSAALIATENALAAQFVAWADPCSIFVPVSTDIGGAWFTGTDYVGHIVTGLGNSGTWVSSDGIHPSQVGQLGFGAKANTAVRGALPPLYTRFNVNWLLDRDINPAANDNSPAFLSKAA